MLFHQVIAFKEPRNEKNVKALKTIDYLKQVIIRKIINLDIIPLKIHLGLYEGQ